ncbi:ABC transporter substrate-binding protein [Paenibacillus donghaensis]|uniref:ABC transporter substrate-binding protein n=1 Tax=Paenibacillus donghaensis TaxID=414771 RepID=A0A2Z2KH26_9BACL|nr:ABC transporter substrate-binding protein [Paenibacillus donghaensis]ASA21469.1 ABC transporter substrate-binding protein [Paenibacillus donghaensis]
MFTTHTASKSKKSWLLIPLLLTLILLLSACGDSNAANSAKSETGNSPAATVQPSAEASPPADTAETGFKTVTTVNGEIEIPTQPKRIVAEEYLGSLIALDTIPVGAPGLTLKNMYYQEALQGVEDTGEYGKMSAEKILALAPDLIISGQAESYEALSKIAPTVIVPYGDLKDAHEELTYFGKLLGKEAAAEEWLSEYDRRIAEAKAKVDKAIPAEATFTIMEDGGKSIWVYGDNFGRGGQPIYQALGRKPPAAIADEIMEKQWAEISAETLSTYAGDYIIMTSNSRTVEDYKADSIWSSLPAVKSNHLYVWKEERSWYYDPIAVLSQTEELAEWLSQ